MPAQPLAKCHWCICWAVHVTAAAWCRMMRRVTLRRVSGAAQVYVCSSISMLVPSAFFSTVFFSRASSLARNTGTGPPSAATFSKMEISSLMMSQMITMAASRKSNSTSIPAWASP